MLKKRDFEAAEQVGGGIDDTGTRIKRNLEQETGRKEQQRHLDVSSTFDTQSERGYDHEGPKGQKDSTPK